MLFLVFGLFMIMSCEDADDCGTTEAAAVLASDMVDTASVNESVAIEVEFDVYNGCGGYGGSSIVTNGNIVTVTVDATYIGCICTQAIERIEHTLNYTPSAAGTYVFEFKQNNTVTHQDTLVVVQ